MRLHLFDGKREGLTHVGLEAVSCVAIAQLSKRMLPTTIFPGPHPSHRVNTYEAVAPALQCIVLPAQVLLTSCAIWWACSTFCLEATAAATAAAAWCSPLSCWAARGSQLQWGPWHLTLWLRCCVQGTRTALFLLGTAATAHNVARSWNDGPAASCYCQ